MPSLTSSNLYPTSSLTDTSSGAGGQAMTSEAANARPYVGASVHYSKSSWDPSNLLLAQNGKLTQQLVNSDQDLDLDLDLRELQLEKKFLMKNSLLDDNDLLINARSSVNTNKYSKSHSKSDGMPYNHNYDLINKYSGASIADKSMLDLVM